MEQRYPFKILNAYTREDADIFFGRDEEVDALYQMVFQSDIILVYGASGTGKTSLIQCGLAAKFQSHDWLPLNIRRGNDLNVSLENALQEAGEDAVVDETDLDWLDEDLSSDPGTPMASSDAFTPLARRLRHIYLRHFKPIYLIFDQFEELYILGNQAEQARFIETIKAILRVEQPVKIVVSIREEYLGYLYEFERQVPEFLRKKLRIEPMTLDKVTNVLLGVNGIQNSLVHLKSGEEKALAEVVFNKIRGKEKRLDIDLPYLQVFLDQFYLHITKDETRLSPVTFSLTELQTVEDFGDVLRNLLDTEITRTTQSVQVPPETLWRILSAFVTLEGTKDPLSLTQLATRLPDLSTDLLKTVLQNLAKLILRYTEKDQRYEIAHDSLARQIHAKRSDEEIALLEVQRLVRSQAALKVDAREFFTEKQLLFIEPFLPKFQLSPEEKKWIQRSQEDVEAKKLAKINAEKEALLKAQQQAEQERSLREEAEKAKTKAEAQQMIAHNRLRNVRILLGIALFTLLIAGWQYLEANRAQRDAEIQRSLAQQKAQEATKALELFKAEQAAKMRLEFVNLEERAEVILTAHGCASSLIKLMRIIASTHQDSTQLKQHIVSLESRNIYCR